MKKDHELSKKVGFRIKDLRKKRGITQEKLAEKSGIDPKHIQLMEGLRPTNPRVDTVKNISEALGLTISEFFADSIFINRPENETTKKKSEKSLLKARSPFYSREKLFEDNLSLAIYDAYPVTRGHILIFPKRNFPSYFDALPEEKQSFWSMIEKAKEFLDREYKPEGYNIGINIGDVAGQTIEHMHIHVIPRYRGDTSNPKGGVRGVIPEKQRY